MNTDKHGDVDKSNLSVFICGEFFNETILDTSLQAGVNSSSFKKPYERSALLMSGTTLFIPDAVGKIPSRSAPVDRN
jgi:hypothetical protein